MPMYPRISGRRVIRNLEAAGRVGRHRACYE
jgi:hypothetical protein